MKIKIPKYYNNICCYFLLTFNSSLWVYKKGLCANTSLIFLLEQLTFVTRVSRWKLNIDCLCYCYCTVSHIYVSSKPQLTFTKIYLYWFPYVFISLGFVFYFKLIIHSTNVGTTAYTCTVWQNITLKVMIRCWLEEEQKKERIYIIILGDNPTRFASRPRIDLRSPEF